MEQEATDFKLSNKLNEFREKERLNPLLIDIFKGEPFYVREKPFKAVVKVDDMMFVFGVKRPLELKIRPGKTYQQVGNATWETMDPFKIQLIRNILSYRGNREKYAKILAEDILEYKKRKEYEKKYGTCFPVYENGKYEAEISMRKIILQYTLHLQKRKIEVLRKNLMKEYDNVRAKNREFKENKKNLSNYISEIEKELNHETVKSFHIHFTKKGFKVEFENTKYSLLDSQLRGLLLEQRINQSQEVVSLFSKK